jgi:hypothetical protein
MIAINKTITESTTCDGAQWKVIYHHLGAEIQCFAILYLYVSGSLYKTTEHEMPSNIYDAWGNDDSVIQDWLFQLNGITVP